MNNTIRRRVGIVVVALLPVLSACSGGAALDDAAPSQASSLAPEPIDVTVILMRHGESEGNASGLIDTSTPGPHLTDRGRLEAEEAAASGSFDGVDGVFASTMVRSQETAQYIADDVGESVEVLAGLREVEAGDFEGQPERDATGYLAAPQQWLKGDYAARIPGSIDGYEFDGRFDDAMAYIATAGDTHPLAVAHGASIMLWTLMNVDNPDPALLSTSRLKNTDYVVVKGNSTEGWTLLEWNGQQITP